jgi:hypothetical protein
MRKYRFLDVSYLDREDAFEHAKDLAVMVSDQTIEVVEELRNILESRFQESRNSHTEENSSASNIELMSQVTALLVLSGYAERNAPPEAQLTLVLLDEQFKFRELLFEAGKRVWDFAAHPWGKSQSAKA